MASENPNENSAAQSAEAVRDKLEGSFGQFEKEFRMKYPLLWGGTLVAPVVLTALALGAIYFIVGWESVAKVVGHAGMTFFVFGRFIILFGMPDKAGVEVASQVTMEPLELFGMVTFMDFITALFVTFHMGVLFKLPWVGEKIAALVWDGKFLMDSQPWIKRIAWFGLVAFVIFPTSTTGSIGGSIFGRLLGMGRLLTLSGVLIGSILGNGLMYVFAKQINKYISPDNIWLKIFGVVVIVLVFFLLERRYQAVRKKHLGAAETQSEPEES